MTESDTIKLKRGVRFLHSRVLCTKSFDGKTPQLYEISRVTYAAIYVRPVYDLGGRETLGAPSYFPPNEFWKWCKEIIATQPV